MIKQNEYMKFSESGILLTGKKLLSIFLVILSLSQFSFADDISNIKQLFTQKIDGVVQIVSDKSLSKDTRNTEIVQLLDPIFDFELMAKLSLGRKWFSLSPNEQDKFVKLYVERMKQSYSSKLDAYSGEKIEISDIQEPKSSRIILTSNLVSKDTKFEVVYKFYKPSHQIPHKNDWLIYDVEIEGVSILKTDRAQFSEYLQQHTISDLMRQLAKK